MVAGRLAAMLPTQPATVTTPQHRPCIERVLEGRTCRSWLHHTHTRTHARTQAQAHAHINTGTRSCMQLQMQARSTGPALKLSRLACKCSNDNTSSCAYPHTYKSMHATPKPWPAHKTITKDSNCTALLYDQLIINSSRQQHPPDAL
jgi:hypothetical protein